MELVTNVACDIHWSPRSGYRDVTLISWVLLKVRTPHINFWDPRFRQTGTLRLSTFWTRLFPTPYFSSFAQIVIKSGFHEIGSTPSYPNIESLANLEIIEFFGAPKWSKMDNEIRRIDKIHKTLKLTNSDIHKIGPPIITFVFTVLCNIELFEKR